MSGIYLVTTPIGNIKDMTPRAIDAINSAEYIYSEDTRVFKKLASFLGINVADKKIYSYHDHSSEAKLAAIIATAHNHNIVFVSDAGSPIISDPAFPLVQLALSEGIEIHSISGISAVTCALELSGLPPIPYHFHGFLARESSKKHKDFEHIGTHYGTHIYFEGVSRIIKTLAELTELYPDFDFVVARELTKEYESVYRFKGRDFAKMSEQIVEKGEFVFLVHNPQKQNGLENTKLKELAEQVLSDGGRAKSLSKLLSALTGRHNKEIYNLLNSAK